MKIRTRGVHLTNEARLLKQLRITLGLSMRAAGELCGRSDSYISQIENGRMCVPKGAALERLLEVYESLPVESFYTRAQKFKDQFSEKEEILELLQKTNEIETAVILKIVRALIA